MTLDLKKKFGLANYYANGWTYCTLCEKYYPPNLSKGRCVECNNILRRKSKINRYNKNRNDGLGY